MRKFFCSILSETHVNSTSPSSPNTLFVAKSSSCFLSVFSHQFLFERITCKRRVSSSCLCAHRQCQHCSSTMVLAQPLTVCRSFVRSASCQLLVKSSLFEELTSRVSVISCDKSTVHSLFPVKKMRAPLLRPPETSMRFRHHEVYTSKQVSVHLIIRSQLFYISASLVLTLDVEIFSL